MKNECNLAVDAVAQWFCLLLYYRSWAESSKVNTWMGDRLLFNHALQHFFLVFCFVLFCFVLFFFFFFVIVQFADCDIGIQTDKLVCLFVFGFVLSLNKLKTFVPLVTSPIYVIFTKREKQRERERKKRKKERTESSSLNVCVYP